MYHESVHTHAFGKLGAMREISLAIEDGYRYWYAGYYIHSCAKMKYKAEYKPQYMLDPVSYEWWVMDDTVMGLLDEKKFVSISQPEESPAPRADDSTASDVTTVNTETDTPIYSLPFAGVLTKEELLEQVDLDSTKLRIRGQAAEASMLIGWEEMDIDRS